MVKGRSDLIDVACTFLHETDAAILVEGGFGKVWLPKSMIEVDGDTANVIVTMPEWLAQEKELI